MAKAHATRRSSSASSQPLLKQSSSRSTASAAAPNSRERYAASKKETVSQKPKVRTIREDDEDLNSGFSGYLHSGSGQTMMKLFILGNTLLIVLTFAWPHIRDTASTLRNLWLE